MSLYNQNEAAYFENAYTDAPQQHQGLIRGSLQLLVWLFFHPSAWINQVKRIAVGLRPDFTLTELSWEQWRQTALLRLFFTGYFLFSAMTCACFGFILFFLGRPFPEIAMVVVGGITFGLASGIALGIVGNIALGTAGGIILSLCGAITLLVAKGALSIAAGYGGALAISIGMSSACGVSLGIESRNPGYDLTKQTGSVVVGILIGNLVITLVALLAAPDSALNELNKKILNQNLKTPDRLFFTGSIGALVGAIVGLAGWGKTRRLLRSMRVGLIYGVVYGLAYGLTVIPTNEIMSGGEIIDWQTSIYFAATVSLARAALVSALFALPYILAESLAGPWAGALAGALGSGGGWIAYVILTDSSKNPSSSLFLLCVISALCITLGLTLSLWRPVLLYPFFAAWNTIIRKFDERRTRSAFSLLRLNSAFWDEFQLLPLSDLDDHLVLIADRLPAEGQRAIEYLVTSNQRWAARNAQIELDIRKLERCTDVARIGNAHHLVAAGELAGAANSLFRSLGYISQEVEAALQQESLYNQKTFLKGAENRLHLLMQELTRSTESKQYVIRFTPIIRNWRQCITDYLNTVEEEEEKSQEIRSPYTVANPLLMQNETFIGRTDIYAQIEQLLRNKNCPPMLLYGQRRMGKTSLLNHLGRKLSRKTIPLKVDLQGAVAIANNEAGLFYQIAQQMRSSAKLLQRDFDLPELAQESLEQDPFGRFNEWHKLVEQAMEKNLPLLLFDEWDALDNAFVAGKFDEARVLGLLRYYIQRNTGMKLLMASSKTLEELQHSSHYLINVQVLHLGYLSDAESRLLIERPVENFKLRYESQAVQRIIDLTHGHPALIQLLCDEIIMLKNEHAPTERRFARLLDVEQAVTRALKRSSFVSGDIANFQVDAVGLKILRFIAAHGERVGVARESLAHEQAEGFDQSLEMLLRRELIEKINGGYRFQVEMIRRWFAEEQ